MRTWWCGQKSDSLQNIWIQGSASPVPYCLVCTMCRFCSEIQNLLEIGWDTWFGIITYLCKTLHNSTRMTLDDGELLEAKCHRKNRWSKRASKVLKQLITWSLVKSADLVLANPSTHTPKSRWNLSALMSSWVLLVSAVAEVSLSQLELENISSPWP